MRAVDLIPVSFEDLVGDDEDTIPHCLIPKASFKYAELIKTDAPEKRCIVSVRDDLSFSLSKTIIKYLDAKLPCDLLVKPILDIDFPVATQISISCLSGKHKFSPSDLKLINKCLQGNEILLTIGCPFWIHFPWLKLPLLFQIDQCSTNDSRTYFFVNGDTIIIGDSDTVCVTELYPLLKHVGGLNQEKLRLLEIIKLPIDVPEVVEKLNISWPSGILLHGPPGVGKTFIVKALSNELNVPFFLVNGPEMINKYAGESERELRELFQLASVNASPISIIFFDEVDSIAIDREQTDSNIDLRFASQFLTLMDGFNGRKNVVVIAATNRVSALDGAFRRSGRFGIEIEFSLPSVEGRRKILEVMLQNISHSVDFDEIAVQTEGFSGADLQGLVQGALLCCSRRVCTLVDLKFKKTAEISILQDDFVQSLNCLKK